MTGDTSGAPASELDAELPVNAPAVLPSPALPEPGRSDMTDDKTRRHISYWLLGLLSFLLTVALIATFIINCDFGKYEAGKWVPDAAAQADFLLKILNILFGPVVTLVSSVVGFYFGARTAKGSMQP